MACTPTMCVDRSLRLLTERPTMPSPVSTPTEIGTSWRRCLRRCAVTTISSSSADHAVAVLPSAGRATSAASQTREDPVTLSLPIHPPIDRNERVGGTFRSPRPMLLRSLDNTYVSYG